MRGCPRWEWGCSFLQQHIVVPEQRRAAAAEAAPCPWPEAGGLAAGVAMTCAGVHPHKHPHLQDQQLQSSLSVQNLHASSGLSPSCGTLLFGGGFSFVLEILGDFCFEDVGSVWNFVFAGNQAEITLVLFSHTIQFVDSNKELFWQERGKWAANSAFVPTSPTTGNGCKFPLLMMTVQKYRFLT